jgi:hypothetical protein
MFVGIVMSALNAGFCVSTTITWKEQVDVLPLASVAWYTMVDGVGGHVMDNTVPGIGPETCTLLTNWQSSKATGGAQLIFAEHWSASLPIIVITVGQFW